MKHYILLFLCSLVAPMPLSAQHIRINDRYGGLYSPLLTDLDGDGAEDLLFAEGFRALWMPNLGSGEFGKPRLVDSTGHDIYGIQSDDLNGDGIQDVILYDIGHIRWIPSYGSGVFGPPKTVFQTSEYTDRRVWDTGDPDNDGDADIFFLTFYETAPTDIGWYENDGLGNFTPHILGNYTFVLNNADLDQDGWQDLVLWNDSQVGWMRNTGSGNFAAPAILSSDLFGLEELQLADLDADGKTDLLGTASDNPDSTAKLRKVYWIKNAGGGNFNPPQAFSGVPSQGKAIYFSAILDLDGDSDLDVVVTGEPPTQFWYRNEGNGMFTETVLQTYPQFLSVNFPLFPFDMDKDGLKDLMAFDFFGVHWYKNKGGGELAPLQMIYPDVPNPTAACADDLDADGDLDVVVACYSNNTVSWYPNNGDAHFGPAQTVSSTTYEAWHTLTTDLNGDNLPEIIAYSYYDKLWHWFRNSGNGNFSDAFPFDTSYTWFPLLGAGDMDGDLDNDVVAFVHKNLETQLVWWPNDGAGQFGTPVKVLGNTSPVSDISTEVKEKINLADLDGDNDLDIVARIPSGINWFENDGAGNFSTPVVVSTLNGTPYEVSLTTADIDQDGNIDIAAGNDGTDRCVWFPNQGDGNFGAKQTIAAFAVHSLHFADIDGANGPDPFFLIQGASAISWAPNTGNGQMGTPRVLPLPFGGSFFNCLGADFDQDNDLELLYCGGYELGFFQNLNGTPIISGFCFWDKNENGVKDSTDTALPSIRMRLTPNELLNYSDNDGSFRFYADPGNYVLSFLPDSCWTLTTDSATFHITADVGSPSSYLFGFKRQSSTTRTDIQITSAPARCATEVPFWVTLDNSGCDPAEVSLRLVQDPKVDFVSAGIPPALILADTITWQSIVLQPGQTRTIPVIFTIPPLPQPTIDLVFRGVIRTTDEANMLIGLDTFDYLTEILCSFDPNDKRVSDSLVPPDYWPDRSRLYYTVRFQNTGNDTAYLVRIVDTLDARLDWSTLRPLGASHLFSFTLDLLSGRAEYLFDNIDLPDSTANEPGSHGFVTFSAALKPGLSPGDTAFNTAHIYFDYNPAVVTNTVQTVVQLPSNTNVPQRFIPLITVWPNPAAQFIEIGCNGWPDKTVSVALFNSLGKRVYSLPEVRFEAPVRIDVSGLAGGQYWVQVVSADGYQVSKKCLLVR